MIKEEIAYILNYKEFEDLLEKHFPLVFFNFCTDVGSIDDKLYTFYVDDSPLDNWDKQRLIGFLNSNKPMDNMSELLLKHLCNLNILQYGRYIIEVKGDCDISTTYYTPKSKRKSNKLWKLLHKDFWNDFLKVNLTLFN